MAGDQFNTRLPQISHQQIDIIATETGLTKTQVLILALDRLWRDLHPQAVSTAEIEYTKQQTDN